MDCSQIHIILKIRIVFGCCARHKLCAACEISRRRTSSASGNEKSEYAAHNCAKKRNYFIAIVRITSRSKRLRAHPIAREEIRREKDGEGREGEKEKERKRQALVLDADAINLHEYADAHDIAPRVWRRGWRCVTLIRDHNGESDPPSVRYARAFFRSAPRIESWSHYGCIFIIPHIIKLGLYC